MTLAQLREEIAQHERDRVEGARLGIEVLTAMGSIEDKAGNTRFGYEALNGHLSKANRSCELLQTEPEHTAYRQILLVKAELYSDLGKHTVAGDAL